MLLPIDEVVVWVRYLKMFKKKIITNYTWFLCSLVQPSLSVILLKIDTFQINYITFIFCQNNIPYLFTCINLNHNCIVMS